MPALNILLAEGQPETVIGVCAPAWMALSPKPSSFGNWGTPSPRT